MKMTMEFNEELQIMVLKAEKITIQVTKLEKSYDNYIVITSTGIRKSVSSTWDFEHYTPNATDIEKYLFKVAYEYYEVLAARFAAVEYARSAEINSENESELPDTGTELPF
jgi:hypothetical protein